MATTTYKEHTGNNSLKVFDYPFPVLKTEDIKVSLDGVTQTTGYSATTSPAQLTFTTAPGNGVKVRIYRDTDVDTAKGVYATGASIRAVDLNNNQDQVLYALQEEQNQSIQTEDIDDSVITSAKIVDGTIVNADINASAAIAGTKVAPEFGSQNIITTGTAATGNLTVTGTITVSSTVDGRDLANDGSKLDNIESNATADQTNAEIRAAVEAATDSNVFTDADHTKLNAIEIAATADQTASEIKTLLQSDKLTLSEIDTTSIDGRYYTETELDAGKLDNRYYTVNQLNSGQLDNRYYTETEADARFYNLASAEEIQSGETWVAADDKVATTSAIDARIVDLVDDVGGFVPIANELSFPNANPDSENGTGTIVSINATSNSITTDGNGSVGIQNGTVGNSVVTITGLPASTTYAAGQSMLVETTSTLNTYTFHRFVPNATEVTAVAGKITEIGRLGTADAVADMNTLGTAAIVEDMNLLGTASCVADMALLGDSAVIADMAVIADTSGLIADLDTVADIQANVTTVAGVSANVTTVAGNTSNINTVAGVSSDVTTVAGKATEIGLLGTADAIADMNTLGTADVVADLNTLGTADVVSDMNTLAVSTVLNDMDTLATTSNVSSMSTCADNITNINNAPTHATNAAASATTAEAHKVAAAGIYTQVQSAPYNINANADFGSITDTGSGEVFTSETSNILLTMSEGSSTYNYAGIT